MKKTIAALLVILIILSLCACGAQSSTVEEAPAETGEPVTKTEIYNFTESAMDGAMQIPFTVELKEDGSYLITENNPFSGINEYSGASVERHEKYFTTGAMDGDARPIAAWFEADGSCVWVITGEGEVQPMKYVAPKEAEAAPGGMKKIAYADFSAAQVLDLYIPEGEGPFPVIVVVHGGGFKFGDQAMAVIKPVFGAVERGYAVVSVDYRKSGEAAFPAALADVKAAVRWVRANAEEYGFDADKIAIWGESAGAYLALMTALTPEVAELNGDVASNGEFSSAVNALVSFYAPVEFYELDNDAAAVGMNGSFSAAGSFESDFVGQALNADKEYTYKTYWETYIGQLPTDFSLQAWIQVGDSDNRVPYLQSVHFAERLGKQIGEENVLFSILPGADHEDAMFYTEENLAAVYDFLDAVMK